MDIGVKISGTTHAILIGIAIFGAPIFSSDKENPIQISEVSLISSEDFAALTSSNIPILKQPEPVVEEPEPVVEEPEPVGRPSVPQQIAAMPRVRPQRSRRNGRGWRRPYGRGTAVRPSRRPLG